ncbi:hypothetical protein HXX76_012206 [Chlamydomonas incerta]|uniref:Uncharacterized protein n=1 Tax=Chlamydomonas incerta TaxID=51695 RepID=A0A835SI17_CHLIN|nr:hypothetical protein HXX76_012206 [Chlamydomonas incerta]|eukprot:KAG2427552.1 hypothetical protein HXX76_012206 [Chlamydomonas incerta]
MSGRLELMQRLAVRYPLDWKEQHDTPSVLAQMASRCPLAVLQQYYEPWGTGLLKTVEQKQYLLLAAAASPMPDWAKKCEWLWARWDMAAAAFGTHNAESCRRGRRISDWEIAGVMQNTDFPQRLQLLASRGLGSCLERHAPTAAGAIGSTAAVEFCLDQLPALLQQQALAPVAAAGGGGLAAAAAGGPLPAEDPAAQQQMNGFMAHIATAAAEQGHVPVLRLLRGRGFMLQARHLRAVLEGRQQKSPDSLRYLLLEDPADLAPGADDAAADWSTLFRDAAIRGADLPLLRHLHEKLGAAIELGSVARGGSEEALSWAVAALEAAGKAPEPLPCSEFEDVLSSRNWAAADWLVRQGLAPTTHELFRHMSDRSRRGLISIANL